MKNTGLLVAVLSLALFGCNSRLSDAELELKGQLADYAQSAAQLKSAQAEVLAANSDSVEKFREANAARAQAEWSQVAQRGEAGTSEQLRETAKLAADPSHDARLQERVRETAAAQPDGARISRAHKELSEARARIYAQAPKLRTALEQYQAVALEGKANKAEAERNYPLIAEGRAAVRDAEASAPLN